MSFIPKRDVREGGGLSDLERFRMSPMYRAILKKRVRGQGLLVQGYAQKRANLVEKAKAAAAEASFSDALIARLIEAGLERALVDVLPTGPGCTVMMSDRIGKLSKEIKDIVAEIAESEQMANPDETGNGTYVFQIMPKEGVDFVDYLQKLLSKGEKKTESVDPAFKPF